MTEKRFELRLCSNGTYYVYENGALTDIDFDKFNKESADALIDEVNTLYEEKEQLKQQKDKWKQQCIHFKEMLDDMDITYLCDEWIYEELKGGVE